MISFDQIKNIDSRSIVELSYFFLPQFLNLFFDS